MGCQQVGLERGPEAGVMFVRTVAKRSKRDRLLVLITMDLLSG